MEVIVLCAGRSKDVLLREIAAIQELLEEQPDSKCASALYSSIIDWNIG
jgi:hypothetical protein